MLGAGVGPEKIAFGCEFRCVTTQAGSAKEDEAQCWIGGGVAFVGMPPDDGGQTAATPWRFSAVGGGGSCDRGARQSNRFGRVP